MKKIICTTALSFMLVNAALAVTNDQVLANEVDSSISVNPITGEKGEVRNGTLAATMVNAVEIGKLLSKVQLTQEEFKQFEELENQQKELIPYAKLTGIYDFFTVDEWMSDKSNLGRLYTGLLALERFPELLTKERKTFLKRVAKKTPNPQIKAKIKVLTSKK
ncbi:hypothetical protein [Rickettsiales endosymbiont of Stachyamoeba lipophora]|uniref:hypothetical protein n=1 Tax=Rickettsiales endosymbiont of Stachyamoeba lipophora TaxID=2486578 RepID=UPI000F653A20|nr:hypothetical protein [Rickettsiales endosymbiont of Stachyamoeba lipophora]AZL15800.1 hypothetical protein EF513_04480 [Rickettsiales endosymbiont of Stachyamoeba lipophora]